MVTNKMSLFNITLVLFGAVFTFGCGPGPGTVPAARPVPDLSRESADATSPSALRSPLLAEGSDACVRWRDLSSARPGTRARGFAHVADMGRAPEGPWMAIDLSLSPFSQLVLGETFAVDSLHVFLEKAAEARAKGELGFVEWAAVVAARETWRTGGIETPLRYLQLRATHDRLEQAFPGVFGNPKPPSGALAALLMSKIDPGRDVWGQDGVAVAALTRTPLFAATDWSEFSKEVELSLAASVRSSVSDARVPVLARTCSFLIQQRAFAQLISLKGFTGVQTHQGPNERWARTTKIDTATLSLAKEIRPGAWVGANGARRALSAQEIAQYSPASGLLRLARSTPWSSVAPADADESGSSLADEIAFLRATALFYEWSSPASPWAGATPPEFLFGDVQSPATRAIAPADANALAAGLFVMQLKNLAATRIVPIGSDGRPVSAGQPASGAIAVHGAGADRSVRLQDALGLLDTVIVMDEALESFARANRPRESWKDFVSFYSTSVMASLFGPLLFTEAELRAAVPPEALGGSLKENLAKLKFPLVQSSLRLIDAGVSELPWSERGGFARPQPGSSISAELREQARATLGRAAASTRSSALADRVRGL